MTPRTPVDGARAIAGAARHPLWRDTTTEPPLDARPLDGNAECDVAIVGGGYTGLWTAYYLAELDPDLSILVIEERTVGFGASGRNGGWASALFPVSPASMAAACGREAALAMQTALDESVDVLGRVCQTEGIDADYAKGGFVSAIRTEPQLQRARAEIEDLRALGLDDEHLRLLTADETREILQADGVIGGTFTPHCAALQPLSLVRGVARAASRRGVRIVEHTRVTRVEAGLVAVEVAGEQMSVRAPHVVVATEGYTSRLPGRTRDVAPVYSLMLATEPMPERTWEQIGLAQRSTFNDHRHVIIYGQRTADGRLAFGGRGAPYHFGSRVNPTFDQHSATHAVLWETLCDLLPPVAEFDVTHTWGGAIGIARDWWPSVQYDPTTGIGTAGRYVGDGVVASNLAGRTLALLITGADHPLTRLPWVGHRSRRWAPEPLRWAMINAGTMLMTGADDEESRTGRPSRRAALMSRMMGGH